MDGDLNRLKNLASGDAFLAILNSLMESELTNDFWTTTLPAELESSSARNPELFAFIAAQNRLGAPVLFSHKKISDLIDPALRTKKKSLERHHLFPRAWLEKSGETDLKVINQMANYALLEWPENISISDDAPSKYVNKIRPRFKESEWKYMNEMHGLPSEWETMPYESFLKARRGLMASIIRRGFETLQ